MNLRPPGCLKIIGKVSMNREFLQELPIVLTIYMLSLGVARYPFSTYIFPLIFPSAEKRLNVRLRHAL